MNIRSVTTPAATQPPQTVAPTTTQNQQTSAAQGANGEDSFQPAQNEKLVSMLQEQPDVRPEALERAKNLANDPNYPGSGAIEGLAKMFIANAGEE